MKAEKKEFLQQKAREARKTIMKMIVKAVASHIASAYSTVEILAYLYHEVINIDPDDPYSPGRDRFILSKGWGVSALYSILEQRGLLSKKDIDDYCQNGSRMIGIATRNGIPGIEATTGSMGHGLPLAVGIAKALKIQKNPSRVFAIIGDGELDEGSTWEGVLLGAHHKLNNLIVFVDYNKWQSFGRTNEVLNLKPLDKKLKSFNWNVQEIDGHDFMQIEKAVKIGLKEKEKPSFIIAHTVKGKGLPAIEDKNEWHYKTPRDEILEAAKKEGLI